MKKKQTFINATSETDNSYILDSGTTPYANSVVAEELSAPLPYKKFLPEPTEEVRTLLKNAHGEIKYRGTNNYIFQAFLQENNDALKNPICSVLHMNTNSVKSIVITKNYKLPLINIVPAVIWSIPFHQKLFTDAGWWMTFGLCAAFVVVYVVLSYLPIIVAVPSIAGTIILTALFWVPQIT